MIRGFLPLYVPNQNQPLNAIIYRCANLNNILMYEQILYNIHKEIKTFTIYIIISLG